MRPDHHGPSDNTAWAVVWAFSAVGLARLVSVGSLVILARLLAPADFGLLAVALLYIGCIEVISDLGTGTALVYWPTRQQDAAQITFVITIAMGWISCALTLLLAPRVADFFQNPSATPVLQALAWSFPIKALGGTHDALCRKTMRFKARLAPELGQSVGKAAISVVLASAGYGVWSLVWGQLAGMALWTVLLWHVVPWRPMRRLPADLLAPMLAYSRRIVAVNVLAAVVQKTDLLVVGRMLGTAALGYYQVASKVPELAISLLVRAGSAVVFPAFARIHSLGGNASAAYLTTLRAIALATVPAAVGLVLVAEPLVVTAFGDRWRPSIPILQALAICACLRSIGYHAADLLIAQGRAGLLASLGVMKAAVLVPALVLAGRYGAVAVATTMAGVAAATMLLNVFVACRLARISGQAVLAALGPGVLASAIMAPAVWAWVNASERAAPVVTLAGSLAIGILVYGLAVRLVSPGIYRQLMAALRSAEGSAAVRLAGVNSA